MNDKYKISQPLLPIVVYTYTKEGKYYSDLNGKINKTATENISCLAFNARIRLDFTIKANVVAIGLAYSEDHASTILDVLGKFDGPEYVIEYIYEDKFNELVDKLDMTNIFTFGYPE